MIAGRATYTCTSSAALDPRVSDAELAANVRKLIEGADLEHRKLVLEASASGLNFEEGILEYVVEVKATLTTSM